ncbi:LOW QUALITY PROTEIN: hypothetical protein U9M48_012759 [Paspalum notatum var. saurae]|uniref:Reverse transcriptase domain-containing protein n=1 Tax=Paspalum notatum var. saurae TaxID=547442 RepID=A0AAQ3SYZ8_PASNO
MPLHRHHHLPRAVTSSVHRHTTGFCSSRSNPGATIRSHQCQGRRRGGASHCCRPSLVGRLGEKTPSSPPSQLSPAHPPSPKPFLELPCDHDDGGASWDFGVDTDSDSEVTSGYVNVGAVSIFLPPAFTVFGSTTLGRSTRSRHPRLCQWAAPSHRTPRLDSFADDNDTRRNRSKHRRDDASKSPIGRSYYKNTRSSRRSPSPPASDHSENSANESNAPSLTREEHEPSAEILSSNSHDAFHQKANLETNVYPHNDERTSANTGTINLSVLLNFDPSTLDIGLGQEQEKVPSPPMSVPADVATRLQEMTRLLDHSIMQLVKDNEVLCTTLEPVIDQLPSDLKQVIRPVAYLGFFREEVEAATAHITTHEAQASLRTEISDKCAILNQQKKSKNEVAKEIQRLQQRLSTIDNDIKTTSSALEEVNMSKQKYEQEEHSSEKEVKDAIFSMEHNKAPGPDGFPAEFYQVFWKIIKADLMAMFYDFYKGDLCLFSLNFGVITLLQSVKKQLRFNNLYNGSYKQNKCNSTESDTTISNSFLPGRYILEGVTILYETIHELHRKKLNAVIFKVDFEKAYDNVKWRFLQQTLRMKGFSPLWCQWIQDFVSKGSRYFKTDKGLRQGDLLSPILFNLVVDMLAIFITRAKEDGQISGLTPHLVDGGLSILQYVDDTILFIEHDLEQAKNLKIILCAFEKLSGLKINFHKSELFCYGEAKDYVEHYSRIFGCGLGNLPFRYLGIPMHHKRLNNKDWKQVIFFGKVITIRKKYRLTKWDILCLPKDGEGMGIRNLENVCLLSKWLFKLINEEGIWQTILKRKYLRGKTIGEVQWKPGDSHFWSGLMKVKECFLQLSSFILHDGSQIRFWEDRWFSHLPLKIQYPSLYNIARKKNVTVSSVFSSIPLNISFRRALVGEKLQKWEELVTKIALVQLDDQPDSLKWNVSKQGQFTVNSMYEHLMNQIALPLNKHLWKLKLPLKIKIFLWFLFKGVILTKDNLIKRHWSGDGRCCFCDSNESIQHLFFDCHVARFVWRVFTIAFGLESPKNLFELCGRWVIFRATYWATMECPTKCGKKTAYQVGLSQAGVSSDGNLCQS